MIKFSFSIVLLFSFLSSCKSDNKTKSSQLNKELKQELENILFLDQTVRGLIKNDIPKEKKDKFLSILNLSQTDIEGAKIYDVMREIDSVNLIKVEKLIEKYGYPSKALVGEPANKCVFYVIQHSDEIGEYLPLIRKAAKDGDISKTALAMMEDRNLMLKGLEQIYGTQIKGQYNSNGEWVYFLWPVKNADSINHWREQAGFETTIEAYLNDMDVEFKLYNLDDLNDF
jgi:hypothetical protein